MENPQKKKPTERTAPIFVCFHGFFQGNHPGFTEIPLFSQTGSRIGLCLNDGRVLYRAGAETLMFLAVSEYGFVHGSKQ